MTPERLGHHLMETFLKYSELPNFLKFRIDSWYEPSATPSYTAFVEGWGQGPMLQNFFVRNLPIFVTS
jgi:hypothetical protein